MPPTLPSSDLTALRRMLLTGAVALPLAVAGCGGDDAGSGAAKDAGGAAATQSPGSKTSQAAAVDAAFVRQMIPHHQMAVGMARMAQGGEIEHDELRQLTEDVVSTQTAEIEQLQTIAGDLGIELGSGAMGSGDAMDHGAMDHGGSGGSSGDDASDVPTMAEDAKTLGLTEEEMGMSMDMAPLRNANPVDIAFVEGMIPHHEGAIAMAKAQLAGGEDPRLRKLSQAIIDAQQNEIDEMQEWLEEWQR